jgi:hypothetical protein
MQSYIFWRVVLVFSFIGVIGIVEIISLNLRIKNLEKVIRHYVIDK